MNILSNDIISIAVDDNGAELTSLRKGSREYLWQGDPEFWSYQSPILFPIIGAAWNNQLRTHGEVFTMRKHGFARDMDFQKVRDDGTRLEFELNSNASTLACYPFPFRLSVVYTLRDSAVDVEWKVTNTGPDSMSFQIGTHPAFNYPLLSDSDIESGTEIMKLRLTDSNRRGYFAFDTNPQTLISSLIKDKGCIDPKEKLNLDTDEGMLPLTTDLFDDDALIFEDGQMQAVTLCDDSRKPYITMQFDAPVVGVWSPARKNAPFICIEPWYGRADEVGYMGYYEDRRWTQHLLSGQHFVFRYTIIVH